jgi:hypothetical protein
VSGGVRREAWRAGRATTTGAAARAPIPTTYMCRGRYACAAFGSQFGTARLVGCAAVIVAQLLLLFLLMGLAAVASLAAAH